MAKILVFPENLTDIWDKSHKVQNVYLLYSWLDDHPDWWQREYRAPDIPGLSPPPFDHAPLLLWFAERHHKLMLLTALTWCRNHQLSREDWQKLLKASREKDESGQGRTLLHYALDTRIEDEDMVTMLAARRIEAGLPIDIITGKGANVIAHANARSSLIDEDDRRMLLAALDKLEEEQPERFLELLDSKNTLNGEMVLTNAISLAGYRDDVHRDRLLRWHRKATMIDSDGTYIGIPSERVLNLPLDLVKRYYAQLQPSEREALRDRLAGALAGIISDREKCWEVMEEIMPEEIRSSIQNVSHWWLHCYKPDVALVEKMFSYGMPIFMKPDIAIDEWQKFIKSRMLGAAIHDLRLDLRQADTGPEAFVTHDAHGTVIAGRLLGGAIAVQLMDELIVSPAWRSALARDPGLAQKAAALCPAYAPWPGEFDLQFERSVA